MHLEDLSEVHPPVLPLGLHPITDLQVLLGGGKKGGGREGGGRRKEGGGKEGGRREEGGGRREEEGGREEGGRREEAGREEGGREEGGREEGGGRREGGRREGGRREEAGREEGGREGGGRREEARREEGGGRREEGGGRREEGGGRREEGGGRREEGGGKEGGGRREEGGGRREEGGGRREEGGGRREEGGGRREEGGGRREVGGGRREGGGKEGGGRREEGGAGISHFGLLLNTQSASGNTMSLLCNQNLAYGIQLPVLPPSLLRVHACTHLLCPSQLVYPLQSLCRQNPEPVAVHLHVLVIAGAPALEMDQHVSLVLVHLHDPGHVPAGKKTNQNTNMPVLSQNHYVVFPIRLDEQISHKFMIMGAWCMMCNKFSHWTGSCPISLDIGLILLVLGSSFGLAQIQHRLASVSGFGDGLEVTWNDKV